MQREIDALSLPTPVRILGVNAAGEEADNAIATQGRALPWLQDTFSQDVWGRWGVAWRDVRIVDAAGDLVAVYNVTHNDLGVSVHHDELMAMLRNVARGLSP